MDGNTVELAVEQLEFSENAMRYQTSLTFLNNKISGLMSAIKENRHGRVEKCHDIAGVPWPAS